MFLKIQLICSRCVHDFVNLYIVCFIASGKKIIIQLCFSYKGYQRWIPRGNIQENILDVDNYGEGSTASLVNRPFTEGTLIF